MYSKVFLLLMAAIAVKGSFLQTPDQFQATFNSTFLTNNEKLFKPIIIPNVTKSTEQPPTSKVSETAKPKGNETVSRKIPSSKEISQEAAVGKDYLVEEPKTTGNSLKFSSRYSTKLEIQEDASKQSESVGEKLMEAGSLNDSTTTEISEKNGEFATRASLSDRSDDVGDGEEEKDDTREAEQSEIAPTTNEPYSELQRPTSFQSTLYSDDDDLDNYETTSTSEEETDSSEEKEEEESKRSIKDYDNSGSKNYHSIQTPLNHVKYKGAHSYAGGFEPEKIRTRLVSPMIRHHDKPSWPYSIQKGKIEKLNEISDSDETHEKDEMHKEFKTKPKQLDLELAVEKDEFKFDRNKKYNRKEERNRRNQQQKGLAVEEEKDEKVPLYQSLKHYQVDEELRYKPTSRGSVISKFKTKEDTRPSKAPATTPKNIFKTATRQKPQEFGPSNELTHNFHGKNFLGPVVFNHNLEEHKAAPYGKHSTTQKVPIRGSYLKGLLESEKLDQHHLTNQRSEKLSFKTGNQSSRSFNHLEESDEMYNAILANIQSVFGIRTQSLKSASQKGSDPEINLEESKSLTWSLPLTNRTKLG